MIDDESGDDDRGKGGEGRGGVLPCHFPTCGYATVSVPLQLCLYLIIISDRPIFSVK